MQIDSALTYADVLRPTRTLPAWLYDVALVVAGSVLIAASAKVSFVLPRNLVPITGQTFAVLLIGALYGSRRGVATVLAYLAEGAAGIPVFAGKGAGVAYMMGPTGGYLIGFVVAAAIVGWLAQRGWDRRFGTTVVAMTLATTAIFFCGMLWPGYRMLPGGLWTAGILPFLPGAIIKIVLAAALLPSGWKLLAKLQAADRGSGVK